MLKSEIQALTLGTKVMVKINGEMTEAAFQGWNSRYDMPNVQVDGRTMPRKIFGLARGGSVSTPAPQLELAVADRAPATEANEVGQAVPINTRFQYLAQLVTMVATSMPTSLIVVGSGGLGKSYTVFETLKSHGLEEDHDYVVCKGMATPKSLYRMLYENRDKIVVFDDCDSVLTNEQSVNLLKASLDTVPVRTLSWRTERGGDDDSSLPSSFNFEGKIIFISNFQLSRINQAILSRALHVDVTMTAPEKIERMRHIAPLVSPNLPLDVKLEVVDMLDTLKDRCQDLNIRTLLKVVSVRIACPDNWRGLAEYVITSGSN